MPNGRCYFHGGPTPGGTASPHFKTGQWSKYVPRDLRAKFNAAYNDSEYAALRQDLALQNSRVVQLLLELDKSPPIPWSSFQEAVGKLRKAETDEEMEEVVSALEHLADKGAAAQASYEKTWRKIQDLLQERTRTAAAENRMLHDRSCTWRSSTSPSSSGPLWPPRAS
jgi:hypothetical protein